ncbi:MAG: hypothetical protein K1X47_16890 [Cyclobacteriaceae bacterium]|nr:hypothetical protein [Cyclobacteriaceae bacterium]
MKLFKDRYQASCLLGEKLHAYRNAHAVIAAIPKGGVPIGFYLSELLDLPLELLPCRRLEYASLQGQTIGSVSLEDTILRDELIDLPQDYLTHQIAQLRRGLQKEYEVCHEGCAPVSFHHKTIVVVDDLLITSDSMQAALRTLRKSKPKKIVVAVPVVSFEAARIISREADDLVYLTMSSFTAADEYVFGKVPPIGWKDVNSLLRQASLQGLHAAQQE